MGITVDRQFLFIGISSLLIGLFIISLFIFHTEWMYGAFLSGSWWTPLSFILFGIGFIYGSFGKNSNSKLVIPLRPNILFDEWIAEDSEEDEIAYCEQFLDSGEEILAIVASRGTKGDKGFNRLALSERRVIFYPKDDFRNGQSFNYEQIDYVKVQKALLLGYLGNMTFIVDERIIAFKNVGLEYANQLVDLIVNQKKARAMAYHQSDI